MKPLLTRAKYPGCRLRGLNGLRARALASPAYGIAGRLRKNRFGDASESPTIFVASVLVGSTVQQGCPTAGKLDCPPLKKLT